MKRILVLLLILLLSPGIAARALSPTPTPPPLTAPTPTPTPTPTPAPFGAYGLISGAVQARVYYEGEWHPLRSEMIWAHENMPGGMMNFDGILHFMSLAEFVKDREIPETSSLEELTIDVLAADHVESCDYSLTIYRQEGEALVRLEEDAEGFSALGPGRYLIRIDLYASGNGSSAESCALLWADRE